MPIDKSRVDRLIKMMDEYLLQKYKDSLDGYDEDEDEDEDEDVDEDVDEDEDEEEFLDPLDAPPSEPFYSDSPPEQVHGQPKKDLFK